MKALLLARVSSKEQEEGQSIPAQIRRHTEYAQKKGFDVEQVFQITESSTRETRKEFEKILTIIRKSRHPYALIADTIDRVQRSFKESFILNELRMEGKVEIHFYRENLIINQKSNSSDILRWDMGVMFAKSYVLQMSDNIKRSKEEALKKGIWVGLAPFGYLHTTDDKGAKTIIPDPNLKYLIGHMFEQYASGNTSLLALAEKMHAMGMRTKSGRKVAKSQVEAMLKNPFYSGVMNTKNGLFPHHYEPLISQQLFQRVQDVFAGFNKKPFKAATTAYILKGLITCDKCGCVASPEIKKGKYIYYSCTNAKNNCSREYVREEVLLVTIQSYFGKIQLPDSTIEEITNYLRSIHDSEQIYHKEQLKTVRQEQDRIQKRISQMYDDKLDGLIDEGLFRQKLEDYKKRQSELRDQLARHETADLQFHVIANQVMQLAKRAWEIFESSEVEEKRQLLNFVFQNLKLDGKNLLVTLREPFHLFIQVKDSPGRWGRLDSNQRRPKSRDLQSLAIAAMRHPQKKKDAGSRT